MHQIKFAYQRFSRALQLFCDSYRVDERREDWRLLFQERFSPLISGATGLSGAALTLNREIWQLWNITFKANQTPDIMSPFQVLWAFSDGPHEFPALENRLAWL